MKKFIAALLTTLTMLTLVGCGNSQSYILPDEDGYAEGALSDTMRTYFFDYTVNSAYLCDEYAGYSAADGYDILVADVTINNYRKAEVEMYDVDFQIQWNDDADDAFSFPLTFTLEDGEPLSEEMLPGTYQLAQKESRTGLLVYEVPEGNTNFSLSYVEYFDDDSVGDTFFVYFDAAKK